MRTGIDIAKIDRFLELVDNNSFLARVFSQKEINHILEHKTQTGRVERIAGKFCAKEAVAKMLGCGIGDGVNFIDIEILPDNQGCPHVTLFAGAKNVAEELGLSQIEVSISHDGNIAIANCVAL